MGTVSDFSQNQSFGGCNPVNWLSQTRRNLTNEYLNLNFVATFYSFYAEKGFFFLRLAPSRLASAYTSKPFRYRYFVAYRLGFKVFNQIGTRWYFELVENKKCFARETAKEVVEGLGTGSFATVTNLAPHSCGCGEVLPWKSFLQCLTPRVSEVRKLFCIESLGLPT